MGDSLKGLVDSLVGRSEILEAGSGSERASALEALEDLSHLSRLTESSFETASPPVVTTTPLISTSTPSSSDVSPNSTPAVQVSDKYQSISALKDHSVLEALLDYHRLRQPQRGVKAAPMKTPAPTSVPSESPAAEARPPETPMKSGFRPAEIPVVDQLQAKNQAGRSLRASQPTSAVLRSKRP